MRSGILLILVVTSVATLFPASFAEHRDIRSNNIDAANIQETCSKYQHHMVYLNHTIYNGTLTGVCSFYLLDFFMGIDADEDGYIILDIPKDVFNPRRDGYLDLFVVSVNPLTEWSEHVNFTTYEHWTADPYTQRLYVPADHKETWFESEKVYREYVNEYMELVTIPETRDLIITNIGEHDTFDRYKIPFLKSDYLFRFQLDEAYSIPDKPPPYNPQKYTTPIQVPLKQSDAPVPAQMPEDETVLHDGPCKLGMVEMTRNSNSLTACVTPKTAEKLVARGWGSLG